MDEKEGTRYELIDFAVSFFFGPLHVLSLIDENVTWCAAMRVSGRAMSRMDTEYFSGQMGRNLRVHLPRGT